MSEVLKSANSYLDGTHKENVGVVKSIKEKLARFSDPFLSAKGELCVKLRAYERTKKIYNHFIKMPGIVINLETDDDIEQLIGYLRDVQDNREVLREVARERGERWAKRKRDR